MCGESGVGSSILYPGLALTMHPMVTVPTLGCGLLAPTPNDVTGANNI